MSRARHVALIEEEEEGFRLHSSAREETEKK